MHGETEGRLQHVLLVHAHAEGQHEPRHVPRELAGELDAAPLDEEIHDGQVEVVATRRREGFGARRHDLHAVALATQHHGQRPPACAITVYQENPLDPHEARYSKARTMDGG
jgi:hypothetical protein